MQENPTRIIAIDPITKGFGYAVFGKVVKGQDVVDKIEKVATTSRSGMSDVPVEPVVIKSVTVVK